METMPDRASNLNMTKDVNANVKPLDKKGKPKDNVLKEVIKKYLENSTKSESVLNTIQDHKEETNIRSKGVASQNQRKEQIDSKQKITEHVTDLLSLKSTSTDVRKAQNCQNVSRDEEKKCLNIFNEFGESNILTGHASNKDRNRGIYSHEETPFNRLRNTENLRIPGTPLKIASLDVSMEGTTEMIGKDIAAKLNEPRIDMVIALVGVIGKEAALRIFKQTQKVEAGGGLMIKNGTRRRTAGGTFFQLIREMRNPNIDMEKVNSVFERLNEVEKMASDCVEKKGNVILDRPCDYFNDTGICKFKSGHFSQSGFTRRIHSCRFCFYRHDVEILHPEIDCRLYRAYFNSISTFQSKEERSNKLQNGDVTRQSKATAFDKILEERSNKLQNGDVTRQSKATAFDKILEERSNKLQNGDVTRQSKATAFHKILTGSNAVPIGIRARPTDERKRQRGPVEQEIMRSNSVRSAIMSRASSAILSTASSAISSTASSAIMSTAETGIGSQTEQFPPSTGKAPSADEHSSSIVCGIEIDRATGDICKSKNEISGNGCQRSRKMVQFQNNSRKMVQFQNNFGGEKDMKKAKEKLTTLSDQISKSGFKNHQDYQAKKERELVEGHSSVGKSLSSLKNDELDPKNMDCKLESQNSKDKNRKGKSRVKCPDKFQGKAKQGEILEMNDEKKKVLQDGNRGKGKNIEVEKQEVNECAHDKSKLKGKYEKKKEIVQNEMIENTAEEKEKKASKEKKDKEIQDNENLKANKVGIFAMKTPSKENYPRNINDEVNEKKRGLFIKKDDKEQTQITAVKKYEKKQGNKFEENKDDKPMQKPETKLSNSSSVDLFRQRKPVAQFPHGRLPNRKEKLHCPCPPYCPKCLNIVKMEK